MSLDELRNLELARKFLGEFALAVPQVYSENLNLKPWFGGPKVETFENYVF